MCNVAPLQGRNEMKIEIGEKKWEDVKDEATQLLREYIKINTTNPPGNEIEGAKFLKHVLEKEVRVTKAKKVTIKSDQAKSLIPDGELFGKTPITIECLAKDLSFFWL